MPDPVSAGAPHALLMPGQGAQYPGMGTGLYRDLPAFAAALDGVFRVMGPAGDELRSDWLAADPVLPVDDVRRSQPLLFAIDYALGRLLMDMGSRPVALLGHSIGEMAAAALAGVFRLERAVHVLRHRVGQVAAAPGGGMLAVAASLAELEPYLEPGVDIAAVNAPRQTVIAGAGEPLAAALRTLREAGFTCAPVSSRNPFHSAVLEPVVEAARPLLASSGLRPPEIAMVSGYTARELTGAQATDPLYWARQPADPVLFWPALGTLLAREPLLLIECGPGDGLITLARRHPGVRSGDCQVLPLIGTAAAGPGGEAGCFAAAAARLGLRVP